MCATRHTREYFNLHGGRPRVYDSSVLWQLFLWGSNLLFWKPANSGTVTIIPSAATTNQQTTRTLYGGGTDVSISTDSCSNPVVTFAVVTPSGSFSGGSSSGGSNCGSGVGMDYFPNWPGFSENG